MEAKTQLPNFSIIPVLTRLNPQTITNPKRFGISIDDRY